MTRPLGIDLFAGAGGMSLGFEQAGFDIAAAVEIDPIHALVHRFNFPRCAVLARSVEGLTGVEIRAAAGIGKRPVDVVFGGPPCQGFSLIGKRAMDDPRNHLVRDFVRLARELDAASFVFENVKGLTLGTHRRVLDEVVAEFQGAGFDVHLPWRVLNARDHGVPQHRERLILMGTRGRVALEYPPADSTRPTCMDALGDLPDAESFTALLTGDATAATRGLPSAYAATLRCTHDTDWHHGHPRRWDPDMLTSSARSDHSALTRRRFAATTPGSVEPVSRFFRLAPDGVSNTLRAGTDAARGAFTSPRPIHYAHARCVTVREMARLHGYPDWFRFHATKWHGARQIGNSVPPPLARAVAETLLRALGHAPRPSHDLLDLGDPAWLSCEMTDAAAHFRLPYTPAQRVPNGTRKRRQFATES